MLKYSSIVCLWDVTASYKKYKLKGQWDTQAAELHLSRTWSVSGYSVLQIALKVKQLNLRSLNALILFLKLDQL